MVVELLCIVLMALVFYLIYCPEDPLGIVMKYRKITCLPVVNCCYHTTHVCEPFSTTHHRKKSFAFDGMQEGADGVVPSTSSTTCVSLTGVTPPTSPLLSSILARKLSDTAIGTHSPNKTLPVATREKFFQRRLASSILSPLKDDSSTYCKLEMRTKQRCLPNSPSPLTKSK